MGQPPTGDPEINDDPYPTENKDPKRRRIVCAGGEVAIQECQGTYSSIQLHQEEHERLSRMKTVRMNGYGRMK